MNNNPLETWPIALLNSAQSLTNLLRLKPVGCFCKECEPDDVYRCAGCKRLVPYCYGAADKYYDYCDQCAANLSD